MATTRRQLQAAGAKHRPHRCLRVETLESRSMLSAVGLAGTLWGPLPVSADMLPGLFAITPPNSLDPQVNGFLRPSAAQRGSFIGFIGPLASDTGALREDSLLAIPLAADTARSQLWNSGLTPSADGAASRFLSFGLSPLPARRADASPDFTFQFMLPDSTAPGEDARPAGSESPLGHFVASIDPSTASHPRLLGASGEFYGVVAVDGTRLGLFIFGQDRGAAEGISSLSGAGQDASVRRDAGHGRFADPPAGPPPATLGRFFTTTETAVTPLPLEPAIGSNPSVELARADMASDSLTHKGLSSSNSDGVVTLTSYGTNRPADALAGSTDPSGDLSAGSEEGGLVDLDLGLRMSLPWSAGFLQEPSWIQGSDGRTADNDATARLRSREATDAESFLRSYRANQAEPFAVAAAPAVDSGEGGVIELAAAFAPPRAHWRAAGPVALPGLVEEIRMETSLGLFHAFELASLPNDPADVPHLAVQGPGAGDALPGAAAEADTRPTEASAEQQPGAGRVVRAQILPAVAAAALLVAVDRIHREAAQAERHTAPNPIARRRPASP